MVAAGLGHLEVVELLLINGAYVNDADNQGCTVLAYATLGGDWGDAWDKWHMGEASGGNLGMVKLLLANGVAVDEADEDGRTVLMAAALGGHLQVVELLLANGADVDQEDGNEWTALAHATLGSHLGDDPDNGAETSHRKVVELLLSKAPDEDALAQAAEANGSHGEWGATHALVLKQMLLQHPERFREELGDKAAECAQAFIALVHDSEAEVEKAEADLTRMLEERQQVQELIAQATRSEQEQEQEQEKERGI
jgi:ankyrin repeat protein